ncbi:hypothetical protein IOC62_14400 [Delftia sp. SD083]|uniref:hypothetical protein n=1 Tax=unclassified Delftia TaxID=2613839 RepID=UPI001A95B217|nr:MULTISPECIES: hypothetical protein [unclassified Delftia]MBO0988700.1 hypothetical protein [Delftia sp. SD083]
MKLSISIIIRPHENPATGSLSAFPLSTEDLFRRVWLVGAESIHASWIPLFQIGIDLDVADIPFVCLELNQLLAWLKRQEIICASEKNFVAHRISGALNELQSVLNSRKGYISVFIG